MLCSDCNKNNAEIFINKIENGVSSMEGLCRECAQKRGIEIPSGKAYRKVFETWDIYDYHWYESKSEAIKNFETKRFKYGPDTLEEAINAWKKYYYRK